MFIVNGEQIKVCKLFFQATLGFTSRNPITTAMKSLENKSIVPSPDKRGKHAPPNKLPDNVITNIQQHNKSYDPNVSHCRRAHAPKRLYLPSKLSTTEMHKAYNATEEVNVNVGYETYRRQVTDVMNISFCKFWDEECCLRSSCM